jgi:hypothetical protein
MSSQKEEVQQLEMKIFCGLKSIIKSENKTDYTNFFVPISPKYQGPYA